MTLLYPKPALLIGASVNEKPNFMTAAWAGIANLAPPLLSIALGVNATPIRVLKRTRPSQSNIPSEDLVTETDYCVPASGVNNEKVDACGFTVFYGKLKTAPLIEQCPVNLECRLAQKKDFKTHVLCIGQIEDIHINENCLTNGKPDLKKCVPWFLSQDLRMLTMAWERGLQPDMIRNTKSGLDFS